VILLAFTGGSVPSHAAGPPASYFSATCIVGDAPPAPCRYTVQAIANGIRVMTFTVGNSRHVFRGTSQSGWWSGTLNGKPAMGHELNRGNVTFSTTDLRLTLQYWTLGNEHGTY
jgi:hypothetical protein